jgi:DNA-directed RNA polymerase subunit RPC12/RpoP
MRYFFMVCLQCGFVFKTITEPRVLDIWDCPECSASHKILGIKLCPDHGVDLEIELLETNHRGWTLTT